MVNQDYSIVKRWQNKKFHLIMLLFFSTDFVDALSKPLEYLSQAEKRAKQMQSMGIEEVGTATCNKPWQA